jgi:hypothetical protein
MKIAVYGVNAEIIALARAHDLTPIGVDRLVETLTPFFTFAIRLMSSVLAGSVRLLGERLGVAEIRPVGGLDADIHQHDIRPARQQFGYDKNSFTRSEN